MIALETTNDPLLFNSKLEEDIEFFNDNLKREYNKKNNLPDFLEYHSSFVKGGKQGFLGLLSFVQPDRETNEEDSLKTLKSGNKYVYKLSQHINFLIRQEYNVLEGLNGLRDFCPHFCKTLGYFKTEISQNFRKLDNPFELDNGNRTIEADVLIMESIDSSRSLYRYIKSNSVSPEIVMSLVKQTLLATMIAGEKISFSHYDLHSKNVLIKKCEPNSAFLYILDENRTYLVPTYGYYPVIIDFGFAYNMNCEGKPLYGTLCQTDIGFLSCVYDQNVDAKLFLSSVSYEMKNNKKSDISDNFRSLVKTIYKNCNVDLECGWDEEGDKVSVSEQLLKKMRSQFKRSKFFKEQGHYIIDMLQTLVYLPLKNKDSEHSIEDMTGIIVTEFGKIEREISSDFTNLYIFKKIVDSVRMYRKDYINGSNEVRIDAVKHFREDILKCIDSIVKHANPKINWEKLLCALLCLSKTIEGFCYQKIKKVLATKKSDYNNMALKNTTEVFEAIDCNIKSHFVYDSDTVIYCFDAASERSMKFKLPDKVIDDLNEYHPFERGTILYEYIAEHNI
jgi:hypothetical protein